MPLMYSSGITMNVADSLVAERERQGWVKVDDKAAEKKSRKGAKAEEPEAVEPPEVDDKAAE